MSEFDKIKKFKLNNINLDSNDWKFNCSNNIQDKINLFSLPNTEIFDFNSAFIPQENSVLTDILNSNSNLYFDGQQRKTIGTEPYIYNSDFYRIVDKETGIILYVEKNFDSSNSRYSVSDVVNALERLKDDSFSLASSINEIILSGERNPTDVYWSEFYGYDFYSAATGGGDAKTITFYNCASTDYITNTLYHEAGHCYDGVDYGISTMSEWRMAAFNDGYWLTEYAANAYQSYVNNGNDIASYCEDFAEAIGYIGQYGYEAFKNTFPNRAELIKNLIPDLAD